MRVLVRYFALLKEESGLNEEELAVTDPRLNQVYLDLARRHGFTLPCSSVRPSVNGQFVEWEAALKEGDVVVFIPPVAGG